MQVISLSNEEAARSGFNIKVRLTFEDVRGFTSESAENILPVFAGNAVRMAGGRVVRPFSGGSTSALTITVGDAGDSIRFSTSRSVHAGASPVTAWLENAASVFHAYTGSGNIQATFEVAGGAMADLTAGELELYFGFFDMKRLGEGRAG